MFTRPPDIPESDLERDLRERWLPSAEQMRLADQYMRAFDVRECFTIHLLLNKEYGCWTERVQVVPIEEAIYGTRDAAEQALRVIVERRRATCGYCGERDDCQCETKAVPVLTGGYAHHFDGRGDCAAVWESIFTAGVRRG